jgi:hypothetical protein
MLFEIHTSKDRVIHVWWFQVRALGLGIEFECCRLVEDFGIGLAKMRFRIQEIEAR